MTNCHRLLKAEGISNRSDPQKHQLQAKLRAKTDKKNRRTPNEVRKNKYSTDLILNTGMVQRPTVRHSFTNKSSFLRDESRIATDQTAKRPREGSKEI